MWCCELWVKRITLEERTNLTGISIHSTLKSTSGIGIYWPKHNISPGSLEIMGGRAFHIYYRLLKRTLPNDHSFELAECKMFSRSTTPRPGDAMLPIPLISAHPGAHFKLPATTTFSAYTRHPPRTSLGPVHVPSARSQCHYYPPTANVRFSMMMWL